MAYKIRNVNSTYLIIEGSTDFRYGLLFPHNIVFEGNEISLPFANSILQRLQTDVDLLDEVDVLYHFGKNNENAMLGFECKVMFQNLYLEDNLEKGVTYTGTVLAKSFNKTIVGINGHYGYIKGISASGIGDYINLSLVEGSKNNFGFSQFAEVIVNSNTDYSDVDLDIDINDFLERDELEVLDEGNRTAIEWLLQNSSGLSRKNINIIKEDIHISYRASSNPDLQDFLRNHPEYFKKNLWLSAYRDKENHEVKLIIFDNINVVLECQVNESGIWAKEFSHDKIKKNAQYLLDHNQNPLIISGKHIFFHEEIFVRNNYKEIGERILAQFEVAKTILPGIKKEIKNLKEKAGVEYITLKKYLAFQEEKENEFNKSHSIVIRPHEASITTVSHDGISSGLAIRPNQKEFDELFSAQEEDICHVELITDKSKIPAKMISIDNEYVIEFHNTHLSLSALIDSGFEIRKRASTGHLALQQDSIDNFVYARDSFDIFEKLNHGDLSIPEIVDNIQFFNKQFNDVEGGNNQPLAIKKAINNKDIFLIQGPPGTGKTSVIIEIIKQLVINRNERVLVCSQAHSAVKNIYDRLIGSIEGLRIGNIDEEATMTPDDIDDLPKYLENNEQLLSELSQNGVDPKVVKRERIPVYEKRYSKYGKRDYPRRHAHICDYYSEINPDMTRELPGILSELRSGIIELGDEAKAFNDAKHYQSLNVVMGTCIGIAMDSGLKVSGLRFDTVIIDEAGKANLSETTVPMQLGRKFILVGDQNQLPPYMDREEIGEFLDSNKNILLGQKEVEDAISSSLFEDFLTDTNFPAESTVLLNFQYRMNPGIGDYISKLFYNSELHNGRGTEFKECSLDGFPNPVTFIDTSTNRKDEAERNIAWEQGNSVEGWYNSYEIEIFKTRILPQLERLLRMETDDSARTTVGIITPYRKQRQKLLSTVKGTTLEKSVYTIDSIQGSEFDVVVLSLVRSFNPKWGNRNVGFLDDMRRLNVALSRAKKRLIIIGNLNTLCDEKAHRYSDSNNIVNPVEVFKKLKEIHEHTAEKTSLGVVKSLLSQGILIPNQLFNNVRWYEENPNRVIVQIGLQGTLHSFPLGVSDSRYIINNEDPLSPVDVRFLCVGDDGRAKFKYSPSGTTAELISKGYLNRAIGEPVEWIEEGPGKMKMEFSFEDGSVIQRRAYYDKDDKGGFYRYLLNNPYVRTIPLHFQGEFAFMDKDPYVKFKETNKIEGIVEVEIIDDDPDSKTYLVRNGDTYGKMYKRHLMNLSVGQKVLARIKNMYDFCIIYNIYTKRYGRD